jgi:hypothetical protein
MKKKGSLSLSVNAIVILILAITMLGLGLGFIKGMFGKVSTQVDEQISQEPAPPAATGGNPITLSREAVITQAGESIVLKVQIYNPTSAEFNSAQPTIDCGTSGNAVTTGLGISYASGLENPQTNSKNVAVGSRQNYNVLLDVHANTPADTYLCRIIDIGAKAAVPNAAFDLAKDLTITVRQ